MWKVYLMRIMALAKKSQYPNLQDFSFAVIKASTDSFSSKNKLGEGGFGPVYKGKFADGQEVAVKRLSESSKQGQEEFINEVTLTAKLQHVNLVRLLGFCTKKEEKLLIYGYMPNKSLDCYLYDQVGQALLEWEKRVHIIEGVTQGLLYLQEYSRFTIIHRDLKASNILLDNEMRPKIADFGIARLFRKDEHEANTGRIVGTDSERNGRCATSGPGGDAPDAEIDLVTGHRQHRAEARKGVDRSDHGIRALGLRRHSRQCRCRQHGSH